MKYCLCLILLISCSRKTEIAKETVNPIEKANPSQKQTYQIPKSFYAKYRNLKEICSEKDILKRWISENYYPNINFAFHKDTLSFEFDGQCSYSFPIKIKNNGIHVYYDKLENCSHKIFIMETFGLRKHPKMGEVFMILNQINDSTLNATYLFQEWTDSVNSLNQNYPAFVKSFKVIDGRK